MAGDDESAPTPSPDSTDAAAADAPAPATEAPAPVVSSGETDKPSPPSEPAPRPARRKAARKPLLDDDPEALLAATPPEAEAEPPVAPPAEDRAADAPAEQIEPVRDGPDSSADQVAAAVDSEDSGVPEGTVPPSKSSRDAVALSAASSAAFAAAASWAAAAESGSKPLSEPIPGGGPSPAAGPAASSTPGVSTPVASTGTQPTAGSYAESFGQPGAAQSTIGEQPLAGQSAAGQPSMGSPSTSQSSMSGPPLGQAAAGEPSGGYQPGSPAGQPHGSQAPSGQAVTSAPAPPVSPGSSAWQSAAQPAGSPAATAEQAASTVARPLGGAATSASAPWLAEPQTPGAGPASGGQIPATLETGKQPLIIPASSDPPWIEKADEAATVAWVPPAAKKGPTDTPWVEPEVYRSEIEVVKPPDELGGPVPTGVICSACGTENDTTRRFCRSCGNPLFAIETPTHDDEEPKRRSWRWLAILVPILLVAGLLGFGGAALIRGGLFGSPGPSAGATTPPAASTGTTGVRLKPTAPTASSSLGDIWAPGEAIDGDPTTSWREKGRLAGQWIQVSFRQPVTILSITIWAGAQKDEDAYKGNLRPRRITVAADGGQGQSFELSDTFGAQEIAYKGPVNSGLRITIQDAYPSTKTSYPLSPTQDCVISELVFNGMTP